MQDDNNDDNLDFTAFVSELGLDQMTLEKREEALASAIETINFRVLARIMNDMPKEDRERLQTLAAVAPDSVQTTILNTVPKDQQLRMFQEEIDTLKEEIKQDAE